MRPPSVELREYIARAWIAEDRPDNEREKALEEVLAGIDAELRDSLDEGDQ